MGRLKLKGSTLIEVLVAMVMLLFLTAIATVVIVGVAHTDNDLARLRARIVLRNLCSEDSIPLSILQTPGMTVNQHNERTGTAQSVYFEVKDSTGRVLAKRQKVEP